VLRWDAEFAVCLSKIGEEGATRASGVLGKAAERMAAVDAPAWALWRLWNDLEGDGPPRWLTSLARALWRDVWRRRFEMEQAAAARVGPLPFLPVRPALDVAAAARKGAVRREGDTWIVDGGARWSVPLVDAALVDALAGVDAFATRDGIAAMTWAVRTVHEQAARGMAHPEIVTIPTGAKLAEAMGVGDPRGNGRTVANQIIAGWTVIPIRWSEPDGSMSQGMIVERVRVWPSGPHRDRQQELHFSPALIPGMSRLPARGRLGRVLVPWIPLPPELANVAPPHRNQAARLDRLLLIHVREGAAEMARCGAVAVDLEGPRGLFAYVGLTDAQGARVLDILAPRWRRRHDGIALAGREGDEAAALANILEAGRLSIGGTAAGKASAARRGGRFGAIADRLLGNSQRGGR
jgi:hypothetical protein